MATVVIYWSATFWNKIRPDKILGLIQIQTAWHCHGIPKLSFKWVNLNKRKDKRNCRQWKKNAKLPSMHIDNFWVDLGELYIILTVHGSGHKKSKCIKYHKWIQVGQTDGLNHVCDTWLSCILSYQAPYLQHTEEVHQSIIIIKHYSPPSKMLKLYNSIHA